MLIVDDEHLTQSGRASLDHCCPYCGKAYVAYPLVMSDDSEQTVYHVACALELATDLLVDLYTFFSPPAPTPLCLHSLHQHLRCKRKETTIQSTNLDEIKAALWEQSHHPCTQVKWGMAQVMAVRHSKKGELQALLRGWGASWCPVESVPLKGQSCVQLGHAVETNYVYSFCSRRVRSADPRAHGLMMHAQLASDATVTHTLFREC